MMLTAISQSLAANADQLPEPLNPPRVPNLLVRNRTATDDITPVGSSPASRGVARSNTSDESPANGASPQLYHSPSIHDSSPKPPVKEEKRKRGMLGFFTLREPSISAWEEFAQQQRAENSQKGANPSGFSTKKLPETVPKVNSKWDGLPTGARERSSTSASFKRSMDLSSSSGSHMQGRLDSSLGSRSAHKKQFSDNTISSDPHRDSNSRPTTQQTTPDLNTQTRPSMSTETSPKVNQEQSLTDYATAPLLSLFFPDGNSSTCQARPNLASSPSDPIPASQPRSTPNAEAQALLSNGSPSRKQAPNGEVTARTTDAPVSTIPTQHSNGVAAAPNLRPFRTPLKQPVTSTEASPSGQPRTLSQQLYTTTEGPTVSVIPVRAQKDSAPTVQPIQGQLQKQDVPAKASPVQPLRQQSQFNNDSANSRTIQSFQKQPSSSNAQPESSSSQPFAKQPIPDAKPNVVPSVELPGKQTQLNNEFAEPPTIQVVRKQPRQKEPPPQPFSPSSLAASEVDLEEAADAPAVPMYRKRPHDNGSEPSADFSPYALRTPEDPTVISHATDSAMHPAARHSRKRSTEDAPQWPLSLTKPPLVPPKSTRRSSSTSQDDTQSYLSVSGSESDDDKTPLDSPFASPSQQIISKPATVGTSVRSFSRPLQLAKSSSASASSSSSAAAAVPMGTISIVRNQQMYTHSAPRAPPAFQPGRVVTKDSDLATIPESDTASVRTLSIHMAPTNDSTANYTDSNANPSLRTTMDFSDTDTDNDEYDDGDVDTETEVEPEPDDFSEQMLQPRTPYQPQTAPGALESDSKAKTIAKMPRTVYVRGPQPSLPDSPPELPPDWHKTPRERLGLGGVIRRNDGAGALWAGTGGGGGEADVYDAAMPPSVPVAALSTDAAGATGTGTGTASRKGSLLGVFKRS